MDPETDPGNGARRPTQAAEGTDPSGPGFKRPPDGADGTGTQTARRRLPDSTELAWAVLRRWRFLTIVAVVAALATLGVYLSLPTQYRATATVVVPASQGQTSAPVFVAQAVANFEGAILSDAVARATSSTTGVPADEVARGISVQQAGTSQLVEVSFIGVDADSVSAVAEVASKKALALLVSGGVDSAQRQVDLAKRSYTEAEQAISDFLNENGMILPDQTFHRMNIRLLALRDQLGRAQSLGDNAEASRLQDLIAQKQSELTQQVIDWDGLQEDRQRAIDALKTATSAYDAAKSFEASAQSGANITASSPVAVSKASQLPRRVLAAAAVALVLAAVFVVVLELATPVRATTRRRRRGGPARVPAEVRRRGQKEDARAT